MRLVPSALGIVDATQDDVEGIACDASILLVARGESELAERHSGKRVRKDIVRLDQRLAFPREREVPVERAIVSMWSVPA